VPDSIEGCRCGSGVLALLTSAAIMWYKMIIY